MINQWQFFNSLAEVKNFVAKLPDVPIEKLEVINLDIEKFKFPCLAKFLSSESTYNVIYDVDLLDGVPVNIKREIITDYKTTMPVGSKAFIVDILEPWKAFIIEFKISAPELVTDYRWETARVKLEELEFTTSGEHSKKKSRNLLHND